jgi:hypothetical protein
MVLFSRTPATTVFERVTSPNTSDYPPATTCMLAAVEFHVTAALAVMVKQTTNRAATNNTLALIFSPHLKFL